MRRPFREAIGAPLRLDQLKLLPVPSPFTERYRADGDAGALTAGFVGFFRAFSKPSLRDGLGLDDGAVEALYRRLAARTEAVAAEFESVEVMEHAIERTIPSRLVARSIVVFGQGFRSRSSASAGRWPRRLGPHR